MTAATTGPAYVLGHSPEELQRLDQQGAILRPLTLRMLTGAGIREGMRVLDVGCGSGDVSLLVRELVGAEGHVTAADRSPEAVGTTRDRFLAKRFDNGAFIQGEIDALMFDAPFDAVVGRLVLMYQPDPAATLRELRRLVRPGGCLAFIEIILPDTPLYGAGRYPAVDRAQFWVAEAFRRAGCAVDMGLRQTQAFEDAGLGYPEHRVEGLAVAGHDAGVFHWLAGTVRSLLPVIVRTGVATEAEVGIDTLAERLVAEAAATRATVLPIAYGGAWASLPAD